MHMSKGIYQRRQQGNWGTGSEQELNYLIGPTERSFSLWLYHQRKEDNKGQAKINPNSRIAVGDYPSHSTQIKKKFQCCQLVTFSSISYAYEVDYKLFCISYFKHPK